MKNNKSDSFKKLIDSTFENIDGILIQKGINKKTFESGYIWGESFYKTIEEVRAAMMYAAKAIQLSIVNKNGEEVDLPKFYTDKYRQRKGVWAEYKKDQDIK